MIESTFEATSNASPPLIRMPRLAPRPQPTTTAVGVAKPSAQGQEITKQAIPNIKLNVVGSSPRSSYQEAGTTFDSQSAYHTMYVRSEVRHTVGTNTAETESATVWIGTERVCAS
mmetsp:Transcript_5553/g.14110  ORF Transcript_5553/g.14110 Transcript_5553/m.14110 type:complete len:115 (+) Transcript_5553:1195-1539(+)